MILTLLLSFSFAGTTASRLASSSIFAPFYDGTHYQELSPCSITAAEVKALQKTATAIIRLTHNASPIILAGQSPAYLWPFLKRHRTVYRVAFSGSTSNTAGMLPTEKSIKNYCQYLSTIGLDAATIQSSTIVDYTRSFDRSVDFVHILRRCSSNDYFPQFINLVEHQGMANWTSIQSATKAIPFIHIPVIFEYACAFANNAVPRSIPHYPYWKWMDPPDMNDPDLLEGKTYMDYLEKCAAKK